MVPLTVLSYSSSGGGDNEQYVSQGEAAGRKRDTVPGQAA